MAARSGLRGGRWWDVGEQDRVRAVPVRSSGPSRAAPPGPGWTTATRSSSPSSAGTPTSGVIPTPGTCNAEQAGSWPRADVRVADPNVPVSWVPRLGYAGFGSAASRWPLTRGGFTESAEKALVEGGAAVVDVGARRRTGGRGMRWGRCACLRRHLPSGSKVAVLQARLGTHNPAARPISTTFIVGWSADGFQPVTSCTKPPLSPAAVFQARSTTGSRSQFTASLVSC